MILFIKSTELSRTSPKTVGYVPTFASPNKLRARARAGLGEAQSEQLLVQRIRMKEELVKVMSLMELMIM